MIDANKNSELLPPIMVTDRSYSAVIGDLSIPEGYFAHKRVLSIGEGLSSFAKTLAANDINITALDSIYAKGEELLRNDSLENHQVLDERGRTVEFKSYRVKGEVFDPPTPDKVKMIAGDVYNLPFKNNQFDLIVANRLFEHVDMQQALPQMIRSLSDTGELRLGGTVLHCIPRENRFIAGIYEKDPLTYGIYLNKNTSLQKALKEITEVHPEVSVYVVVGNQSRYSAIYDTLGAHLVKNLIFVKGSKVPEVEVGQTSQDPYLGRLYKLDPVSLEISEIL